MPPALFDDYSDTQRSAVDRAVQHFRPGRPLRDDEWQLLRRRAKEAAKEFAEPKRRRKREEGTWSRIARVCRETEKELTKLMAPSYLLLTPFDREHREALAALKCLRDSVEKNSIERDAWRARKLAEIRARGNPEAVRLVSGRKESKRVKFQMTVLEMLARFGGKLTHGKNRDVVDGPAWRFFEAVVRPVMGNATPSRSGFPDIVRRRKRDNAAAQMIVEVFEAKAL
jgi:hypothetical protein